MRFLKDFVDLFSGVTLHPGLIVILENVRRTDQLVLFDTVLEVVSKRTSLINTVVEIKADGTVTVFDLPKIAP